MYHFYFNHCHICMIIFLLDASHPYTHSDLQGHPDLPPVKCYSYDWLLKQKRLPSATYIFTDRERMDHWQVRTFADYYQRINSMGPGFKAINNPATMLNRRALLRKLYVEKVNPYNAYAVTERQTPEQFPVFIRNEFDHHYPVTGLIESAEALEATLAERVAEGHTEDGLLIIEYCAQPHEGQLFRKLSTYKVGDQVFFHDTVHEENWLVKYGTLNAATQAMYEDEYAMIQNNAFAEELRRIFELAGIDYGRADFGIVNGKPVLYEINTNPTTRCPKPDTPHPNATRNQSVQLGWQKYVEALTALDTASAGRPQKIPLKGITGLKRSRKMQWQRFRNYILR